MNLKMKFYLMIAVGCLTAAFPAAGQSLLSDLGGGDAGMVEFTTDDDVSVVLDTVWTENPTAYDYFLRAPMSVFPTLEPNTRADMHDYYEAGMANASKTLMGGECRIISETPARLEFATSSVSTYTIDILPAEKYPGGEILMVTRTLKLPAEDSTLRFYTTDWKEIHGIFKVPELADWLTDEGRRKRADTENVIPYVLAKLSYSPESRELTFTNSLADYIPAEDLGLARSAIAGSISYKWNGKKLVKVK